MEGSRTYCLRPESELRLEVSHGDSLDFALLKGTAEVYGCEMLLGRTYHISGDKIAVFTFDGATLEVRGKSQVEYVSEDCTVPIFLNVHLALENARNDVYRRAKKSRSGVFELPVVLVLGYGRGTTCRTLMNYATRQSKSFLFVDLDVDNRSAMFPGVLSCTQVCRLWEIEERLSGAQPVAFYFGDNQVKENPKKFRLLSSGLAVLVQKKKENIAREPTYDQCAGVIIRSPQPSDDFSLDEIEQLVSDFGVTVILTIGNERLFAGAKKRFDALKEISVVNISKSSGVHINFLFMAVACLL